MGFVQMIRVRQVKVKLEENTNEHILKEASRKLKISPSDILSFEIKKQSLDARKKDSIFYIYELEVKTNKEKEILRKNHSSDIVLSFKEEYQYQVTGTKKLLGRPIVVGSGPAGLFAAYLLAEHHYHPLIIERGEDVDSRIQTVEEFWNGGTLNPESNIQFGEGGAGTFSDGKLNTLVKDVSFRGKKVFKTFVSCGAPKEIMYLQKPHIGTDILRTVVKNMREKIIEMGGEFRYQTKLTNLLIQDGKLNGIEVNHQEQIPCECLVLAIGHSARDTFQMLYDKGIQMEAKPFAVGVRIMHPQKMINESQYGKYAKLLPPASYKLTYTTKKGRGVYSFCMCPGGYVVNASSEEGYLAINGMSNYARDGENANSALVVTVGPKDFGVSPLSGMIYQRKLEDAAYRFGKGKIPIQLFKDFNQDIKTKWLGEVKPTFQGKYEFSNLNDILPVEVSDALKEAIPVFGTKIQGYDRWDTILSGVESRTSSPVRIVRNEQFLSNIFGIYPCGEGAGYAGGITTAAIDGIKVFEEIAKIYQSEE